MTSSNSHPLSPSDSMAAVYKTTYKRTGVLLPQIERHVLRKAAEPNDRSSVVLHPSEMARNDWCNRHDYYRVIGTPTEPQKLSTSFRMENIYEEGHSIHNKWQRWMADMGILWGNWQCKDCGGIHPRQLQPNGCGIASCSGTRFRYMEVPIVSQDHLIAGHADGITITDKPRLIEIKTIGLGSIRYYAPLLYNEYEDKGWSLNDLWYRVNRPFGSHIKQAMLYLHIAKQLDHEDLEDLDEIVFIYEFKATQDAKEFVVKYNIDLIQDRLDEAEAVVSALRDGSGPPPRPPAYEEAGPTGTVCGNCEYRTTCWGSHGTVAAVITPTKPPVVVRRASAARRRSVVRR